MTHVHGNRLRHAPVFRSNFSTLLNEFFPEFVQREAELTWKPVVDIQESENNIKVTMDLPGVKKEEIAIRMEENVLSISGERIEEKKNEMDQYRRKERFYGKFRREFTLPSAINHDKIKADYKNGVLTIEIPKPDEQKPKTIAIH